MNDQLKPNKPPLIWVLLDDRAGNRSQCLGVADILGLPFETHNIVYTPLSALPNMIKGASFIGITQESRKSLVSPWPDLVITAGRRTASVARAIKQKSFGKTRLVQIMYPGDSGLSEFDLVAVPGHDKTRTESSNILSITGAPHGVTAEKLSESSEKWRDKFQDLPSPKIALFVGGTTRRREFSVDMGKELGKRVNKMALDCGGSLLITTSRRSGAAGQSLITEITAPNFTYQWGDEGDNPYFGYLAMADAIVVSGDSVSMCSEACATKAPVYIYAPEGFVTDKHARLHQQLYDAGFARPLEETVESWSHPSLNAATEIVQAIRERFGSMYT